ncbi:MAG: hypothetical protein L0H96_00075 [Humibacillus sp.]|nr:hypothetical protein [Humibacillus sp.]MDN5775292.1 hypothetical protein [Humibacillus sp.]
MTTDCSGDPAVYRSPWQTALAPEAPGTETDVLELVQPVSVTADEWTTYRETVTVDVLLHHRDSRRAPIGSAMAYLLWRSGPFLVIAGSVVDDVLVARWPGRRPRPTSCRTGRMPLRAVTLVDRPRPPP